MMDYENIKNFIKDFIKHPSFYIRVIGSISSVVLIISFLFSGNDVFKSVSWFLGISDVDLKSGIHNIIGKEYSPGWFIILIWFLFIYMLYYFAAGVGYWPNVINAVSLAWVLLLISGISGRGIFILGNTAGSFSFMEIFVLICFAILFRIIVYINQLSEADIREIGESMSYMDENEMKYKYIENKISNKYTCGMLERIIKYEKKNLVMIIFAMLILCMLPVTPIDEDKGNSIDFS